MMSTNSAYGHRVDPSCLQKKKESGRSPQHPVESILPDADLGIASFLDDPEPDQKPKSVGQDCYDPDDLSTSYIATR